MKWFISDIEKISFNLFKREFAKRNFTTDRFAVEPFLNEINRINAIDFIAFNFKWFPRRYTHDLMICLPEIFKSLEYKDLIKIGNLINESLPLISFIDFIQWYVRVDSMEIFNALTIHNNFRKEIEEHYKINKILEPIAIPSGTAFKDRYGIDYIDFYNSISKIQTTASISD